MFLKNCHSVYKKNCNIYLYNMCKVEAGASDDNVTYIFQCKMRFFHLCLALKYVRYS